MHGVYSMNGMDGMGNLLSPSLTLFPIPIQATSRAGEEGKRSKEKEEPASTDFASPRHWPLKRNDIAVNPADTIY